MQEDAAAHPEAETEILPFPERGAEEERAV